MQTHTVGDDMVDVLCSVTADGRFGAKSCTNPNLCKNEGFVPGAKGLNLVTGSPLYLGPRGPTVEAYGGSLQLHFLPASMFTSLAD